MIAINKSTICVQEATAVFTELKFLESENHSEYVKLMDYYRVGEGQQYYNAYKFKELMFLFNSDENRNSHEETNVNYVQVIKLIAIKALNVAIENLNPLDGKYLVKIERDTSEFNANIRFFKVINYIKEKNIKVDLLDEESIDDLFAENNLPVHAEFDWISLRKWAIEKIILPLGLREIETYVNYQKNVDNDTLIMSASAYMSHSDKRVIRECNEKQDIENALNHCQVMFIDDSYCEGSAILYRLYSIYDNYCYVIASRSIFLDWLRCIPISITDRNHYESIVSDEPNILNFPLVIDMGNYDLSFDKFLKKRDWNDYLIIKLNTLFSMIVLRKEYHFFLHITSNTNVLMMKEKYLQNVLYANTWREEIIPMNYFEFFLQLIMGSDFNLSFNDIVQFE